MIEEGLLKEKAKHYLACYNGGCRRRKHCLHWLVGPHVPEDVRVHSCVNVMNAEVRSGHCPFYKSDTPVMMMRGFTHLYDDMPRRTATAIREELDGYYNHTTYYRYRNGILPVKPEMQKHIEAVCRKHGWKEAPVYDKSQEEYDW